MSRLRSIEEIPEPYSAIFSTYPCFNHIQSTVFDDLLYSTSSVVVTAPTGSGKTAIFELAIVKLLKDQAENRSFKAVYVAPVKALCNERHLDWSARFSPLGISCIEVTGDSVEDPDLREFQIILTTPEKWDSITRRWRDKNSLVPLVKLLMVDEIHLIRDEKRGPVLESIVCRMKTMMRLHKNDGSVRFIGVSATIYNIEDLAAWLGSNKEPAVSHRFGNESRPVTLNRIVKGFPQGKGQSAFLYDIHLSYKLKPLLLSYSDGKPVLIFCSTRRGVEQTCKVLSENLSFQFSPEHKNELLQMLSQITDMKLRNLLLAGVGHHHAGMAAIDRNLVQDLFMNGFLPVLVATSTLAMGVNLPAHLVIIKSTHQFIAGRVEEYSESTVLQMVGRAGRPQFDTSATAVILTRPEMVNYYERLLDCKEVLESSLHLQLAEHLNSEIVLLTIGDLGVAMEWLRCTFLYQRAIKNPKYYGLGSSGDPVSRIEKALETIVLREINALKRAELVEMNDNGMDISPTANGKLMSYFYVSFLTFTLFQDVKAMATMNDLLCLLSDSYELAEVQLRVNERRSLNELNVCKTKETIRFPMKGKISTRSMKVNCLVQACLGYIAIAEPSLFQEALRAVSVLERVCKCLTQYLQRKNWYVAYISALTFTKCLHARLWENSLYVSRQLDRIGPLLSSLLVGCGKTSFEALDGSSAQELERILNKGPPFGSVLLDKVRHLPRYAIGVTVERQGLSQSVLHISVSIENVVMISRSNTAGPYHTLTVVVGDTDNRLLHSRHVPDSTLLKAPLQFNLVLHSPLPQRVFISVISNKWVGLDVFHSLTVNPLVGAPVDANSHISYKSDVRKAPNKTAKKKNVTDTSRKPESTYRQPQLSLSFVVPDETEEDISPAARRIIQQSTTSEDSPPPLSQASYLRALEDCHNISFDLLPSSWEATQEKETDPPACINPALKSHLNVAVSTSESKSEIKLTHNNSGDTSEKFAGSGKSNGSFIPGFNPPQEVQTASDYKERFNCSPGMTVKSCCDEQTLNELTGQYAAEDAFDITQRAADNKFRCDYTSVIPDPSSTAKDVVRSIEESTFLDHGSVVRAVEEPGFKVDTGRFLGPCITDEVASVFVNDKYVPFPFQLPMETDDQENPDTRLECQEQQYVENPIGIAASYNRRPRAFPPSHNEKRYENLRSGVIADDGLQVNVSNRKNLAKEANVIETQLRYLAGLSPVRNTQVGFQSFNAEPSRRYNAYDYEHSKTYSNNPSLRLGQSFTNGLQVRGPSVHQELLDKVNNCVRNRSLSDYGSRPSYQSTHGADERSISGIFHAPAYQRSLCRDIDSNIVPSGNWKVCEIVGPCGENVLDAEKAMAENFKGPTATDSPDFECNWSGGDNSVVIGPNENIYGGEQFIISPSPTYSPYPSSEVAAAGDTCYQPSSPCTSQSFGSETTSHYFQGNLPTKYCEAISSPADGGTFFRDSIKTPDRGRLSNAFNEPGGVNCQYQPSLPPSGFPSLELPSHSGLNTETTQPIHQPANETFLLGSSAADCDRLSIAFNEPGGMRYEDQPLLRPSKFPSLDLQSHGGLYTEAMHHSLFLETAKAPSVHCVSPADSYQSLTSQPCQNVFASHIPAPPSDYFNNAPTVKTASQEQDDLRSEMICEDVENKENLPPVALSLKDMLEIARASKATKY